jgi:hypothetical protein
MPTQARDRIRQTVSPSVCLTTATTKRELSVVTAPFTQAIMAILSEAVFAAHGLSQVKFIDGLESLDGIGMRDREERLTGKAMLHPVPEYPLIVEPGLDAKGKQKAGEEWPQEIYFR